MRNRVNPFKVLNSLSLSVLILVFPLLVSGQNLQGYWQGVSYQASGGPSTYYPASLNLTQNGKTVKGSYTEQNPGTSIYAILNLTGEVSGSLLTCEMNGFIREDPLPFPYYWCPYATGSWTYDSVTQTLKGPGNSPGCAGRLSMEFWRLMLISDSVFCAGSLVKATVTGQNIKWYTDSTLTNAVFSGNTITTTLNKTTVFYVTQNHYNTESPPIPVRLIARSASRTTIDTSICEGTSLLGYSQPGTYTDTFTAVNGCDSIRVLRLKLLPRYIDTLRQTICEGGSFLGHTNTGIYRDTLTSSTGCDSIRVLLLTVNARIYQTIQETICEGTNYQGYLTGGTYRDTFPSVTGCDSIRTLQLTVLPISRTTIEKTICAGSIYEGYSQAGNYLDTFTSSNGCDSIRTIHLTVLPMLYTIIDQTICEGEFYQGYNHSGEYVDTFNTLTGCDSIRKLTLKVTGKPVITLGQDQQLCEDDSLVLFAGQFSNYHWQDGSTLNTFVVHSPGIYSVTVENACGIAKDEITITGRACSVYFPGAFTPNKDGKNDVFRVLQGYNLQDFHLSVYDRWGKLVFESANVTKGWDGTLLGVSQPEGTYVWFSTYKKSGMLNMQKGTVLLMR